MALMFSWRIDFEGYCPISRREEDTESMGVLQVKGKFFICQLTVLLEHGTPEYMFCCYPLHAGIRTGCHCKVIKDKVHKLRVGIKNL